MRFHLTDGDRRDLAEVIRPGSKWSYARDDAELRRMWQPLLEERGEVLLQHANGAVAQLRVDGDVVKEVVLREGDDALPVLRKHGFQVPDDVRGKARAALRAGRSLDEALDEAWPRRHGLREIPAPDGKRRFHLPWSGVLEVDVAGGAVRGHRFLVGGEALDAMNTALDEQAWAVPPYPGGPVRVRTPGEARLFVAVQKSDWEQSRERGGVLEVLAHTPEGRRKFGFRVDGPGTGPLDFGAGTSPCLDPAVLLLFGSTTETTYPDPAKVPRELRPMVVERLELAAAGLREATKFAVPGTDLPPLDIYATRPAAFLRMTKPERFKTASLLADAKRLDDLAARWAK